MHQANARQTTFLRRPNLLRPTFSGLLLAPYLLCAGLCWAVAITASADPVLPVCPPNAFDESKSDAQPWRYKPNQMCPPIPKYEYTDAGQAIMVKRYPYFPAQDNCQFIKFRYVENKHGVEHFERCRKVKREPDEILSEQQKAVLAAWGQPDYLRGPYRSTRGDQVIEWAYHPLNRLFQFVDRTMVYQGPLTDRERTVITYGAPREVIVSQLEPNIRRETWVYRPFFLSDRERLFSFSNGELIYSQETP